MNRFLIAFLIFSILIVGFIFLKTPRFTFDSQFSHEPYGEQLVYLKDLVQDQGPKEAYRNFSRELKNGLYPEEIQHAHAHTFGKVVYELYDTNGISFCDDEFWYGCVHEITGEALLEYGVDIIPTLGTVCKSAQFSSKNVCQHGIGHGMLASLGYAPQDRNTALEMCNRDLPDSDPIYGCNGGVFMEYYDHTMLRDGSRLIPQSENLLDLCNGINPHFAEPCSFRLPQWWLGSELFTNDYRPLEERLTRIEDMCVQASSILDITYATCLEGLGNVIATYTDFDSKRSAEMCFMLTDLAHLYDCIKGAAYRLIDVVPEETAINICDLLSDSASSLLCKEEVRALLEQD